MSSQNGFDHHSQIRDPRRAFLPRLSLSAEVGHCVGMQWSGYATMEVKGIGPTAKETLVRLGRNSTWGVGSRNAYPKWNSDKWNPDKWNQRLNPAVPWWV